MWLCVQMARQRSAPAALSIQSPERLITPPATPSSPQRSEFWGSPPQKSPTHRNPRKKPHKGHGAAASLSGLSRGMKHVASEPQLFALDHTGVDRSTVEPLKLTAHTVSVQQTLPDTEPPILTPSTAAPPRQHDIAPAAVHSGLSAQQTQPAQQPKSISAAVGDAPLSPSLAARIAEAVHKDDATLLAGLVIPSLSSKRELSATSLSTIAESGSDMGSSQANLDQVAEKLCELQAADSIQSDETDTKTDRSSFEFPTKKDPFSCSPAQLPGFPSPAKLRCSPLRQTSAAPYSAGQPQPESAAAEADALVLENGNRAAAAAATQGSSDSGEASSSSAPVNSTHSSVWSSSDSGPGPTPAAPRSDPSPSAIQKSFSITDSALFAPTALKLRTVSQDPPGDLDIKASGRKLQQIPSDSEIVIHVSPGQGHETPFTSGPYTSMGSDFSPPTTLSPTPGEAPASARAAAAAALTGDEPPQGRPEGLPPRPFSPPPAPMLGESSSGLSSDCALEQRDSSSSLLSPTSRAAADVGMFSPRRLPPKLTHTRISGLGDGPRLSGDQTFGSGDRSRGSGDKPPIPGDLSGRPSSERGSAERARLAMDSKLGKGKLFRVNTPLSPPPFLAPATHTGVPDEETADCVVFH